MLHFLVVKYKHVVKRDVILLSLMYIVYCSIIVIVHFVDIGKGDFAPTPRGIMTLSFGLGRGSSVIFDLILPDIKYIPAII